MEKQTLEITELQVSELFEKIVKNCEIVNNDKELATNQQIFDEVHCVPSEYQVAKISTRPEVKFSK